MQYVVTAYDFTDDSAIDRRLAAREAHLNGIKRMLKEGTFLSGGAILDNNGKMIGSTAHVAFETRAQLDNWLNTDPYTTENVWNTIDVREVTLVPTTLV